MTRKLEKDGEVTAEAFGSMCVDSAGVVEEDASAATASKAVAPARLPEVLASAAMQKGTAESSQPGGAAHKHN